MTNVEPTQLASAITDFRRARSQANLQEILSRFTGASTQLLSYNEVVRLLKVQGSSERGLQEIPLDAIVGSVGRYTDFTRDFLPREKVDKDRWARVKIAVTGLVGLNPIDVYQIGDVYFVKDGNHRVSVARQLGATTIQAYVTEVRTRVPLGPDIRPDDLITKAEYVDFLETTSLDELRPEADLTVTVPGKYEILLEHIDVHRYFMGAASQKEIPYKEAVVHWYDEVYLPIVELIRERGILDYFSGRTETDLYLWIGNHSAELEEELGWKIRPEAAASHLVEMQQVEGASIITRMGGRLREAITQNPLHRGPPVGQWRREIGATNPPERLFNEILVPVSGEPEGWYALDQAFVIARRETAWLHGLHVVATENEKESDAALSVQAEFNRRCAEAGIRGELTLTWGSISEEICLRARWTDLVVTNLAYPPGVQPLDRLSSGWRDLIQRCSRPVLAVPQAVTPLNRALLSFDGSPKAREALFVSTYLAASWKIKLWVISIADNGRSGVEALNEARRYLKAHGVAANFISGRGTVAQAILQACSQYQVDLIAMGGYGFHPVLEVVLGSTVDQILRESRLPVLICR